MAHQETTIHFFIEEGENKFEIKRQNWIFQEIEKQDSPLEQ